MLKRRRWRTVPRLTAAQQYELLRRSPLANGRGSLQRGRLSWNFDAQPTPVSRNYRLRLDYRQWETPTVIVLAPDLPALAADRDLPHVYEQTPTVLCLYFPSSGEWHPGKRLVDTIVPWAYLWLFYFEDWLVTGNWSGGGQHPTPRNRRQQS